MSFDIYNKKPKLVESRILRHYNEKLRTKEIKEKIKQEEVNLASIVPDTWYKKMLKDIYQFIKDNYGFFLIIGLILLLLYVRYIEVNRRKKKMKNVIDKIQKEKEVKQFIELQEINKQLNEYD